jgi:hypothetical protein
MRVQKTLILAAVGALGWSQTPELKTAEAVLEKYQQALGGAEAIRRVQSETRRGEFQDPGVKGKIIFVSYAKPFKWLSKQTLPDGGQRTDGFDGQISWSIGPKGAEVDRSVPLESVRRDGDLQYALHQPDYFTRLELAGVVDFEGHRCYWLLGTTHWGKDNNQFYDTKTGLLVGYRFQSDDKRSMATILVFDDYKIFGGPLVPTKISGRQGNQTQMTTLMSVSYEPLADSLFELPATVKALLK